MPLPAANSQALAANLIVRVVCDKKPLKSNKKNNKLVQALCYGCLRWLPKLEAMANYFIQKPLKEKDFDIKVLIFIGLYQLEFLRMPDHAAVFETAKAAECLGKPWAKNFINAILRHYLRNKAAVEEKIKQIPSAFYAHPTWLLTALQKNWPLYWSDIVRCNNERAPMTLRVNIRQLSLEHYVIKLQEANIASSLCQHTPAAILLDVPCEVSSLPGYLEGEFSVQDCAAQLAAPLLRLLPGQRILDACAAPGGKTTHILETEPGLSEVLAIDNKAVRLNKVQENLIRLKLQASVIHGDAADPEAWWDGRYFDRILLDVPCSATGTIRRHPDIKIIRGL